MARYARRPAGNLRPNGPFRHGPIPVIGLVGAIGSGKSRVAELLGERGAVVLDADAIGHALLDQRPAREAVVRRFGAEVLAEGQPDRVDRRRLAATVFEDRHALKDLEAILHPRMRRTFEKAIARQQRRGAATAVVLDAAVLFEAGWDDLCDAVAFVDAPDELRRERVAAARGWSADDLARRERAQWPAAAKRPRATLLLPNAGTIEALRDEVARAWPKLVARPAGPRPRPKSPAAGPRSRPERDPS